MIHRLALLMGGTGAAGVLALALALGGFGAPLSNTGDAFVPVANNALAGGQLPVEAPTVQPTTTTSLGGGGPQGTPKKVVDIVYVAPAPAVHRGKPANDANQPADEPRDNGNDNGNNNGNNNGGNQAGDDQNEGSDDQAGEDDHSNDGDHSDDGGEDDGGHEPGDD